MSLTQQVSRLEEQEDFLKKRIKELEASLQQVNLNLALERFKSNMLNQILQQETGRDFSTLFRQNAENVEIFNYEGGQIDIIVHNALGKKEYTLKNTKHKSATGLKAGTTKPTGAKFRMAKNAIDETKPEEQEEKIKQVEEALEDKAQQHKLDIPYQETIDIIDSTFVEISKNRVYKKSLTLLRDSRNKLLGKLNLNEYISLIKSHIGRLEAIFITKKYDNKKSVSLVLSALSSIDQRLVAYNNYYNTPISADDIDRFKITLEINMDYPRRHVPFTFNELYNRFYNYSIVICPIKDIVRRVFVNPFGFNNVIYCSFSRPATKDPYSFYTLEKIEDSHRIWKMECRLDEFSRTLSNHLVNFCIGQFRKIYFDIFHDNIYREDYANHAIILSEDCEQLISNIFTIGRQKFFCNMLRELIKTECEHKHTVIDKFNFQADDKVVKKNFQVEVDEKEQIIGIILRVFDNMSSEDAGMFYNSKLEYMN